MANHARISCPACQSTLRVRPEYFGQTVACKRCDATFEVPPPDAPAAAPGPDGRSAPGAGGGPTPEAIIRKLLARLGSRERRYEARKRLLAEAEARCVALSAEVEALRARVGAAEALARELSEAREEAGRLSDELAAVAAERDLLRGSSEARARELSDELAAARDELDRVRREAEEGGRVAGELAALRGRLEASEALQAEAARGRDALEEELGVARAEAGRLAEELRRLGADREQLRAMCEGRARELAEERAAAERARDDVQGRLAEAEGLVGALRDELARVRDASAGEIHGAREDAARLSIELVATRADRDLLRESLERRAGELGEARALIRGHAEEFAAARREAEGLRRELAALAEQRDREAREQPEAARQGLGVDIEAFRADLELMRQELAGSLGGRDATLRLIESLAQEREQVTALRDQLKSTFRDGEAVYQAKLAQAAQAIRQAEQAHVAERKRADELAGRLVALEAELARQRREREAERLQAHQLVLALRQGQEAPPTGPAPAPAEPGRGPRMVTLEGRPAAPTWGRVVPPAGGDGPDGDLPMDHRDLALGEIGPLAALHK